jgi:hypothetical protein
MRHSYVCVTSPKKLWSEGRAEIRSALPSGDINRHDPEVWKALAYRWYSSPGLRDGYVTVKCIPTDWQGDEYEGTLRVEILDAASKDYGGYLRVRSRDPLPPAGKEIVVHGRAYLSQWEPGAWDLEIDTTASRFTGASIAGIVVGAMGCFIFGLYLRAWLRERKALASEPPQDMIA